MEFRTGDDVAHPNYGVGNIMRLEEQEAIQEVEALLRAGRVAYNT